MKKVAVGVDLGGTNIRVGLVSPEGKVLKKISFPTRSIQGRSEGIRKISQSIRLLLSEARVPKRSVLGVGFGVPGPVDVEKGLVYFFPNIPGWKNTPVRSLFSKALGLPVFVDNDASAMALGEYLFGAGRGCRNMIALTLGTGVGGGIVLNGKLFHGHAFSATEIGHITIDENGPRCGCGSRGCLEVYVGNGYLVKEAQRRLGAGANSILASWIRKNKGLLTPELVTRAARSGDRFSKDFWRETGEHLGTAVAGLLNVLNPERVVIGGGVAGAGAFVLNPLKRTLSRKAFPIAARSVRLFPAKLGSDAGLIGAASLAFNAQ